MAKPPLPPTPPASGSGAPIEIIVGPDGRVVFTDLPPELQAILKELDPSADESPACAWSPEE